MQYPAQYPGSYPSQYPVQYPAQKNNKIIIIILLLLGVVGAYYYFNYKSNGGITGNTGTQQSSTQPPPLHPQKVNCEGTWIFGECDKNTGTLKKTFNISQQPKNGGTACPVDQIIDCDVNCEGTWAESNCNNATLKKTRTFTRLIDKKNNGTPCPASPVDVDCNIEFIDEDYNELSSIIIRGYLPWVKQPNGVNAQEPIKNLKIFSYKKNNDTGLYDVCFTCDNCPGLIQLRMHPVWGQQPFDKLDITCRQ